MCIEYSNAVDLLTGVTPESSAGVTVDTTGLGYDVSKRSQIVVQFLVTNHASGQTVFSIDGSNDNVHWVTGLACQDLTSVNSATYVTGKTIAVNSSAAVKVPAGFRYIRAVSDVTTDGTSFAFMEAAG